MTALDQAFIKAYKQLGPAGQSVPVDAGSTSPDTKVEPGRLETPTSAEKCRSLKNEAEVLSFVPAAKSAGEIQIVSKK